MSSGHKIIGAIAFGPSRDGTKEQTRTIAITDEQRTRLLDLLAGKLAAPGSMRGADFSGAAIQVIPERVDGHREMRRYDVYALVDAHSQELARGIKSYAFAYALALRWSEVLGQPVKMMRVTNGVTGAEVSELVETADARDTSEGAYLAQQLRAEIGRIQNAKIAMREVADDVRCMIEDADGAIAGLRALAGIDGVPGAMIAQTARAAADHFDTLHWYTLINHSDTDMLGELLATDAA